MNTISKRKIFIVIGTLLVIIALLDLGVHGGNTENTITTKVVSKLIPQSFQQSGQKVIDPNIPTRPSPKKETSRFSITSDPALLRGEGFFYVEDGVLYRNKLENGVVVEYGQKIAEGVDLTLAQNDKIALFTVKVKNRWDNDLWTIDKEMGVAKKIYEDVATVQISPKENLLAVFQIEASEVHLIDENGNLLNKIGIHGGEIAFSNDGNKLAYHKLADNGDSFYDLAEQAYGIAIYDIPSGREFIATDYPGDYYPVGFSSDDTYLYFISNRGDHALWLVNLRSSEEVQLSPPEIPVYINHNNAVWFSDRLSVISETNGKISFVQIVLDQKSVVVQELGEGISPRWKVQDRVIEFKGKDGWTTVDISSFLKK